jgi:hypothetical protein
MIFFKHLQFPDENQLTYRESLRDIEACLRSRKEKLYHLGIRGRVSRSTLAEANEKWDWRIYAGFCQILITLARSLYTDEDFGIELKETAYTLDSTTIDLCLPLFPWASFRKHKADVKMHTLLDRRIYLRPCCHYPKTPPSGDESLHNFTDPECHPF